jgi:hypothetical protein
MKLLYQTLDRWLAYRRIRPKNPPQAQNRKIATAARTLLERIFTLGSFKQGPKPPRMYRPNGKREVARRLRQIQNGQLTTSNGLEV